MDKPSLDLFKQVIEQHIFKQSAWLPMRYKRFPRFTIYTKDKQISDKEHLANHIISLNPHVVAMLASSSQH